MIDILTLKQSIDLAISVTKLASNVMEFFKYPSSPKAVIGANSNGSTHCRQPKVTIIVLMGVFEER